ncbi:hypothetical protein BG541_14860 [Listeria monocytogenes]|nr:hypothetical protein BG541_14860 [Listeria monocytogenes]
MILYCGTVHKFQGKESGEVVFLLGCDASASGAVNWVNENIVNVAVTRAKYDYMLLEMQRFGERILHCFVVQK